MTDARVIEAMLLRWSDTHNGRTVTLLLPADGEHPFKGLKCGPSNGQRLGVSVALIADDETEQPVESALKQQLRQSVEMEREKRKFEDLPLSQQSALACKDARFQKFLEEKNHYELKHVDFSHAETVAIIVRNICGVESRAALDVNDEAAECWRDLYAEYHAWLKL